MLQHALSGSAGSNQRPWEYAPLLVALMLLVVSAPLARADGTPDGLDIAAYIARAPGLDLDVDADRDGLVEAGEDEVGEDNWAYGPEARGALVLANSDDDDGDHLPDNWAGGDFDYLPGEEGPDERVNAFPDEEDLAPLVASKLGLTAFPQEAKIVLRVARPAGDAPHFASLEAKDRIRVFLPTRRMGSDLVVQAGDQAIIGPTAGDRVEFVPSPQPPQRDITLFAGEGRVRFGVEGIRYGSLVDIFIESWLGATKLSEDRVRMRVAPFILSDPLQKVERDPAAPKSVYVEDLGEANAALRASLREVYTNAHLQEATALDRWHQDGYEIGYSKAPYGAMWVVLGLPRGQVSFTKTPYGAVEEVLVLPGSSFRFDPRRMSSLNEFTRQSLLGQGIGLIPDFQDLNLGDADSGGNLEAVPGLPARYLYGAGMNSVIIRFLEAQGVQQGMPVDTSLLEVGHVDELVSYCSDGTHVLIADPEVAWALLLIANRIDPTAEMLEGMEPFLKSPVTVGELVAGTSIELSDSGNLRDYNVEDIMAPGRLPATLAGLGLGSATSKPVAATTNRGAARLVKAGGLVGLMPNSKVRTFRVVFEDSRRYKVTYQERGTAAWVADGAGDVTQDFVSSSRTAFLLSDWWEGGPVAAGDTYTFTVDPTVPWVQIPVLYRDAGQGRAVYLTSNHVNSLVDGSTIITAQAHGPVVDLGEGPVDILAYYVTHELRRAGYQHIVFVDDRAAYHNYSGSVHCATNVLREIPDANWWERTAPPQRQQAARRTSGYAGRGR